MIAKTTKNIPDCVQSVENKAVTYEEHLWDKWNKEDSYKWGNDWTYLQRRRCKRCGFLELRSTRV